MFILPLIIFGQSHGAGRGYKFIRCQPLPIWLHYLYLMTMLSENLKEHVQDYDT